MKTLGFNNHGIGVDSWSNDESWKLGWERFKTLFEFLAWKSDLSSSSLIFKKNSTKEKKKNPF